MVDSGLERMMRQKFSDAGIDRQTLEQWRDELAEKTDEERIPYGRVRPILIFLQNALGVHPTRILNQSFNRYENGMLKSVSRTVYDSAVALKKRTEKVLETGSGYGIEKLKEEVFGGKPDYTLYSDVKEELDFLCKFEKQSAKKYLGRGTRVYEKKGARRIASWRAARIYNDCDRFIRQTPHLPLAVLPRSRRKMFIQSLLAVLVTRTARMLTAREGVVFEKEILRPMHSMDEYSKQSHGFTLFDRVSRTLGMRKKAFDLMVAENCEMFREVGRYDKRWYLSDLYLKELSEKADFEFITAKYEMMAKEINHSNHTNECMH
jgi:hypothetical protein